MKILALVPEAFGGKGGIALYNRDLLTALCNHPECEQVVAIPRLMPAPPELLPPKLTYVTDGINGKYRYMGAAWRAAQQHKPFDLIVCGHINLLPLAYFLRARLEAPVLLETYGIDAWKPTRNPLTNRLVRQVEAAVSISEITRQRFVAWSGLEKNRTFLLPNAIHADRYGSGPKPRELETRYGLEGKVVLMTLGRMSASEGYKGFDEVLEALPDVAEAIPDVAYMAVGDGDDRERLAAKARALGVADRVIFPGYVNEQEKADHYRLADVYVMPSTGEGFGYVLLEAMACGIPVIASERDGTREAVRNGELGLLVDPGKRDQIKTAIFSSLKMPKQIPEGLEYFSFDRFSQRSNGITDQVRGVTT